jgi:hypothetical protein
MKKRLLPFLLMLAISGIVNAQLELAADQNPNFAVSRDKYMKMADSLNQWHSTTFQNTYRAIDWRSDKEKARDDRREFRQQLRLERARWSGYDYRNEGYYNPYYSSRSQYNYSTYRNQNYRWQRPHFWWF